jgi:integrase
MVAHLRTLTAFLHSIDRTTPSGIRDYAIFLLIATYGLRGCDIVALTLDDVAWRAKCIRIQQRKTGRLLWLPRQLRSSLTLGTWNRCRSLDVATESAIWGTSAECERGAELTVLPASRYTELPRFGSRRTVAA